MNTARNPHLPIPDKTGKRRQLEDFTVPPELWEEARTTSFGDIRTISLRHLTPMQERAAAARAKDGITLAYELSKASLAEVSDLYAPPVEGDEDEGEAPASHPGDAPTTYQVNDTDGSREALWTQLHPKIRTLVMQAYASIATPTESAAATFTRSRRTRG